MAEPDQEQLARELEEQLMSLRVEDVLMQSLVTVSSIGFRRLGLTDDTRDDRDLAQSQLAIAVLEALTPVLEGFLPSQLAKDFKGSGSQLKLAYARAAAEEGAPTTPAGGESAARPADDDGGDADSSGDTAGDADSGGDDAADADTSGEEAGNADSDEADASDGAA